MRAKRKNTFEGSTSAFIHSEDRKTCFLEAEAGRSVCERKRSFVPSYEYFCPTVNKHEQNVYKSYMMLTGGISCKSAVSHTLIHDGCIYINPWDARVFPCKINKHLENIYETSGKAVSFSRKVLVLSGDIPAGCRARLSAAGRVRRIAELSNRKNAERKGGYHLFLFY
ncbi:MAG: hypothetical protein LBS42_02750 [Tannerella sp.]|jgi:hypothetical protein|nr:hypothetical protein [Tannerella sp.]